MVWHRGSPQSHSQCGFVTKRPWLLPVWGPPQALSFWRLLLGGLLQRLRGTADTSWSSRAPSPAAPIHSPHPGSLQVLARAVGPPRLDRSGTCFPADPTAGPVGGRVVYVDLCGTSRGHWEAGVT